MSTYIEITFTDLQREQQDILIAKLTEAGFTGFEEEENQLKAYIPEEDYAVDVLKYITNKYQAGFSEVKIESQNWNAVWESGFHPVIVDNYAAIRADFHEPITGVEHEIIITPKMSFGTGHHATTYMMIEQMREIDFKNKSVFDFGTGTGILAILSEKSGAKFIDAVDNDDWSIQNARENIERNKLSSITLEKEDEVIEGKQYDIILANINKNVILENFKALAGNLKPEGILLVSGLLKEDEAEIIAAAGIFSLKLSIITMKGNWISIKFNR